MESTFPVFHRATSHSLAVELKHMKHSEAMMDSKENVENKSWRTASVDEDQLHSGEANCI